MYYILRQITLDTLAFQKALHGGRIMTIEISEKDLLERVNDMTLNLIFSLRGRAHFVAFHVDIDILWFQAKQIDIHNLHPFYESDIFKMNNFVYEPRRKVIVQTLPEGIED